MPDPDYKKEKISKLIIIARHTEFFKCMGISFQPECELSQSSRWIDTNLDYESWWCALETLGASQAEGKSRSRKNTEPTEQFVFKYLSSGQITFYIKCC